MLRVAAAASLLGWQTDDSSRAAALKQRKQAHASDSQSAEEVSSSPAAAPLAQSPPPPSATPHLPVASAPNAPDRNLAVLQSAFAEAAQSLLRARQAHAALTPHPSVASPSPSADCSPERAAAIATAVLELERCEAEAARWEDALVAAAIRRSGPAFASSAAPASSLPTTSSSSEAALQTASSASSAAELRQRQQEAEHASWTARLRSALVLSARYSLLRLSSFASLCYFSSFDVALSQLWRSEQARAPRL